MLSSTPPSSHGSFVRGVTGAPLEGFARDFIRESIKATLKYPQTQAVIRLAVAATILDCSLRGADSEIPALYADLQVARPSILDLSSISRFVHRHYRSLELSIPEIPNHAYGRLFAFEIEQGFYTIGSSALSCASRIGLDGVVQERLSSLVTAPPQPKGSFDVRAWCDCVRTLSAEVKLVLRRSLDLALKDLYLDPRQRVLHDFLVRGLQQEPSEKWHLNVLFPYGAAVTKMGMSAERKYLDELTIPPVSDDMWR